MWSEVGGCGGWFVGWMVGVVVVMWRWSYGVVVEGGVRVVGGEVVVWGGCGDAEERCGVMDYDGSWFPA